MRYLLTYAAQHWGSALLTRRSLVSRLFTYAIGVGGFAAIVRAEQTRMAPEFTDIERWLNSDVPLTVAGLRGKVVLVDFWTYSCINCRRTVPYLNRWQVEYGEAGLQVIGIHTPEFGFERAHRNVEAAVREFGIRYPVGQDNMSLTWPGWGNTAWPAFYLLDKTGRIVLVREGEGYAVELERAIRGLLGLPETGVVGRPDDDPDLSRIRSPEIYFGSTHATAQDPTQIPRVGEADYSLANLGAPSLNRYQLDGTWTREDEAVVLRSRRGGLRVTFSAAKLHLVAAASSGAALEVRVDGQALRRIEVERPSLYTLFDGQSYGEHSLELEAQASGLTLYSVTFG